MDLKEIHTAHDRARGRSKRSDRLMRHATSDTKLTHLRLIKQTMFGASANDRPSSFDDGLGKLQRIFLSMFVIRGSFCISPYLLDVE